VSAVTRCESGHDLTRADAYIDIANGRRVCRVCRLSKMPKRAQERAGLASFVGGK
jgi:hypothetical protein